MEIFKKIPNTTRYFVSNLGRIFSEKNGEKRLVKLRYDKDGYYRFNAHSNGKHKTFMVHKVVCDCFLGERIPGQVVDHKDRNKENNNVSNLRYVSIYENANNVSASWGKSKHRGISYITRTGEWVVRKQIDGKRVRLGGFRSEKDAIDCLIKNVAQLPN